MSSTILMLNLIKTFVEKNDLQLFWLNKTRESVEKVDIFGLILLMRYVNKAKLRHGLGLPTTCGFHNCCGKTGFNIRAIFDQSYFALTVLNNILHHFSLGCFIISLVCLFCKTNFHYDKIISIFILVKPGE